MKMVVDPHDERISDFVSAKVDGVADIGIIGVPFDGSTRGRPGARFAPKCIKDALFSLTPMIMRESIKGRKIVDFGDIPTYLGSVKENKELIYRGIRDVIGKAKRLIILGGDHSITHPSVRAFSEKYGKVGIIVFDAHLDLRELKGNAVSSGTVMHDIINDESIRIDPKNLVYIGIREFVNSEYYIKKAEKLGAKIYYASDLWDADVKRIVEEAYNIASDGTDFVYVSFDVDSLDANYVPGLNAPVPLGIKPEFVAKALRILRDRNVSVLDVTEVAPLYDVVGLTCRVVATVIAHFL